MKKKSKKIYIFLTNNEWKVVRKKGYAILIASTRIHCKRVQIFLKTSLNYTLSTEDLFKRGH